MLTPEEKDLILIKMTKDLDRDWLGIDTEYANIDEKTLNAFMRQLQRRGFVEIHGQPSFGEESFTVFVEMDADDFIQRGGFKFEEDEFRNKFTKLELELAKLEGEIPQERFSNMMVLIGAVSAAVSAYTTIK